MLNTMNGRETNSVDVLIDYQSQKLEDLILEIVQCCKERTLFLSKRFDIPEAELRCLMLFGEERYLTAKGISQKLDVAKSRVTKIINGLVQKRLVESIDDPKDARIKLIGLTSTGQKKSKELSDVTKDLHQRLLLELEPEQRKMVISCLEILRASMEAVKNQMI
jgi:DNA-binding MarR family transcriptional regulator